MKPTLLTRRPCPANTAGRATLPTPPCRRRRRRPALPLTDAELEAAFPTIDLIISDVDGTLLNHKQELTPGVERAVAAAAAAGVPLVVATGKSIGPWAAEVLPRLATRMPQLFIQGLLIRDYEEGIIYSRELEKAVVLDALAFAKHHALTLTAYCGGDRILCERTDAHTDRLLFYREPPPEAIGE
jgi:hydroxymethylpyrimidine pyrophosphatase-like HAD family hydrolase